MMSIEVVFASIGRDVGAVKHMGEYLLGVLESLGHLSVLIVEGSGEGVLGSLTLETEVGNLLQLARQNYLRLVSEVHLHNLVTQSEHYGVFGLHPLLDETVAAIGWSLLGLCLGVRIKVVSEVL